LKNTKKRRLTLNGVFSYALELLYYRNQRI